MYKLLSVQQSVVVVYDFSNKDLKVVKCTTQNCSSFNAPVIIDSAGSVGRGSAIAIGGDNNPIISYYDEISQDLKIVKCTSENCSSYNAPVSLDTDGDVGRYTSIAIGADNNPIIVYPDLTNRFIKVFSCADPGCRR